MRIWIKYIIGIVLGVLAGLILPTDSPAVLAAITTASDFVIHFGRYTLLPLLLFGVSSAVYKLRASKIIVKTSLWTVATIIGSSFLVAAIGLISILLVTLPRIPITGEKITELATIDIKSLVMQLLPYSSFESLRDGAFLLPAFIFAGFAGGGCTTDEVSSKPVIAFIQSASKLFYSIMSFFVDWLSVGMIAVAAYWVCRTKAVFATGIFNPLTLMLLVDFILIVVIIYPVILRVLCKDLRPWHVLYASVCPILAAFISGDSNLALQVNWRHGRESLGIHSDVSDVTFPLFSIFGRGGAALAASICFVLILRSYSPLGLKIYDVLWIFAMSFGLSFVLGAIPRAAPFVALTVLCTAYSRGFDAGYLLLRPAVPIFCSFAAAIDVASAMFGSYIVGVKTQRIQHIELKHYI
ncbi:MAG: dicarboxylate/amino acid:cation symporter [Treponema sp.]|nr:dicarboxylate/amino acid:cation symporter [Treponema sp.]